jgi:hypothetical protein
MKKYVWIVWQLTECDYGIKAGTPWSFKTRNEARDWVKDDRVMSRATHSEPQKYIYRVLL